jgi:hypothetical protein
VADKSLDVPELVRSTFAEKPIALQSRPKRPEKEPVTRYERLSLISSPAP